MYDPHHRPTGQQTHGYTLVPQRQRSGWWWVAGLITATVLVVGAVVAFRMQKQTGPPAPTEASSPGSTSSVASPVPTAAAAPALPEITAATLPSYLASAQQISSQLAGVAMTAGPIIRKPFSGFMVDPFECSGAVIPGSDIVYGGSNFTGFAGQAVSDPTNDHKVIQAVTLQNAMSTTARFFTAQTDQWKQCAGKSVTVDDTKGKTSATVDGFDFTDNIASIRITPTSGAQRQCQHAMTTSRTVIVDVRVCSPGLGSNAAREIARSMGAAVAAAR